MQAYVLLSKFPALYSEKKTFTLNMTSSHLGKVFTITGGASGMGAATARILAQRSAAAIAIADLHKQNLSSIKSEIEATNPNTKVMTTEVDVSSSSAVQAWVQSVINTFGTIDGCANVAGVPQAVGARKSPTILEETDETWKKTMGVNLDGIMFCTREQIRAMVPLPKSPRAIVNVSSLASLMHGADAYGYGASKTACASFTTSVSKDVYSFGIRVNAVSPSKNLVQTFILQFTFLILIGATMTPMIKQFFGPDVPDEAIQNMGLELLEPVDVARAIVFLLSEESSKITGVNLPVGLGIP
jgi:chanoclavine-I dehydrogenase